MVIESRPDSPGIPHGKQIAMAQHSGHGISPVPSLAGLFQYFGYVDVPAYLFSDIHIGITLGLVLIKQALILHIEKMSHLLQHGYCIGILFGILTQLDQGIK